MLNSNTHNPKKRLSDNLSALQKKIKSEIQSNFKEQSIDTSQNFLTDFAGAEEQDSLSHHNSEQEDRMAKMQAISKNKESIFIRKVKYKNQLMIDEKINFQFDSICDAGPQGFTFKQFSKE